MCIRDRSRFYSNAVGLVMPLLIVPRRRLVPFPLGVGALAPRSCAAAIKFERISQGPRILPSLASLPGFLSHAHKSGWNSIRLYVCAANIEGEGKRCETHYGTHNYRGLTGKAVPHRIFFSGDDKYHSCFAYRTRSA